VQYLNQYKDLGENPNCSLEIEAKIGNINVKENREVPAETHAILKNTLKMNPSWQLFIGPDP